MKSSLTLSQALMLLALQDEKGTLYSGYFPQALAGVGLTELLLSGVLVSDSGKTPKYTCKPDAIVQGQFLSTIANYMQTDGKARPIKSWAERISQKSKFIKILAQELCEIGAVSEEKSKLFGLIPQTKWPTVNGRIEAGLIEEIKAALNPNLPISQIDDKIGLLIILSEAAGILRHNLDKDLYKSSKTRLKEMKKAEFMNSEAFVKVIKETEAAIISVIVAAAVIPAVTAG
ncbi:GOLPH3/VPS74 family protein [Hirschia baltica]|uniref:Golgi phosphoprotein 3 n=1 Tax=Hirschia baltica (strain ATCC 49814 / DSM 5838 / IFAM 1418) TaxID=582402 RepID=C6XKK6_HIRBI|nr:GPP34 family phosphoprotein [Hirschia baltica]ACT59573.1 hypothetical protein Hbal_1887 [Hirschia baltica ATCC 49814]